MTRYLTNQGLAKCARSFFAKQRHPFYGDHGFMNKTAEVTFPLSAKVMLLLSWDEKAPNYGAFERDHVHRLNIIRAARSDRYLYAHIRDKRIEELAAKYKDHART